MSHEDPYRPDRERGAYTPPTDDDLPYRRQGGGPRNTGGGGKAPPVTLLVSAGVLLTLIIALVLLYNHGGLRASTDAPPAVGTPVGQLKVEAPIEAQPIDPAEGVDVYERGGAPGTEAPTFVPPPEVVQPRPTAPTASTPAPTPPVVTPTPKEKAETPAPARTVAGVQIGAFSTPGIADREYAAIVGRYPQLTGGASKRVQEVTASNGSTVYRTTVTGISAQDARALCGAIRASGGDCIVR